MIVVLATTHPSSTTGAGMLASVKFPHPPTCYTYPSTAAYSPCTRVPSVGYLEMRQGLCTGWVAVYQESYFEIVGPSPDTNPSENYKHEHFGIGRSMSSHGHTLVPCILSLSRKFPIPIAPRWLGGQGLNRSDRG